MRRTHLRLFVSCVSLFQGSVVVGIIVIARYWCSAANGFAWCHRLVHAVFTGCRLRVAGCFCCRWG